MTVITTRDTVQAAHGRWREILPALGLPSEILNGKKQPCPLCGGVDRFRFTDFKGEGDYFCSHCKPGRGFRLLQEFHGWDFKRTAQEVDKIIGGLPPATNNTFSMTRSGNPKSLRRLYTMSEAINDLDPAGQYLISRGLSGPWPKALRYIDELRHKPTGTVQRGMLAVFCDAEGKPATIHRTFLNDRGAKANVDPVRMFMAGDLPMGGAVRLGCAAERMGIAEGIETAMSAARLFGMPVWATTAANMLEAWMPPVEAKHITIFADNDHSFTGQASAYELAKKIVFFSKADKIEREVVVLVPHHRGEDWNDVLMKGANQ